MLVGVVLVVMFVGQRMETPEQKQDRIDRALAPMMSQMTVLQNSIMAHQGEPGHSAVLSRMSALEAVVLRIEANHQKEVEVFREMLSVLRKRDDRESGRQ